MTQTKKPDEWDIGPVLHLKRNVLTTQAKNCFACIHFRGWALFIKVPSRKSGHQVWIGRKQ